MSRSEPKPPQPLTVRGIAAARLRVIAKDLVACDPTLSLELVWLAQALEGEPNAVAVLRRGDVS
jgi:hypothetical protein